MKTSCLAILVCLLPLCVRSGGGSRCTVIPIPVKCESTDAGFVLTPATKVLVEAKSRDVATPVARYLAEQLRLPTGYHFDVASATKANEPNTIRLTCAGVDAGSAAEAYDLLVRNDSINIRARGESGLFYGVQTLLQLLPRQIFERKLVRDAIWSIPGVHIEDQPRFAWRGLLLDVGRHFFTKQELKQLMDLMALHKLNMFQLHLTDDQGWRLQIRQYPRLAEVGAWRKKIGFGLDPKASTAYAADGRYGGYYSQADIRELVAYARERQITIVPEIEMPGHAGAALAAYPEFSCLGGPYSTDGSAQPGVFCAGNDQTFEFLQNVLAEVCELFPSKYIHIGGDEVSGENWKKCPKCQAREAKEGLKTEHELESYFIRRIETFLNGRGRTLVGWSEIREGGLAKNATIMDWIGGAVESAREGHDVIMTPTEYCYLDYYQSTNQPSAEPKAIGGYVPLTQVYAFEPVPAKLEPEFRAHILGAQGNLWTEYIASLSHAEYMAFPRLCALAEVTWSPANLRDFADFNRRLQIQARRFDYLGINYRHASITQSGPQGR